MDRRASRTALPLALGFLALLQLVAVGYRQTSNSEGVGQRLGVGGDVSGLEARDPDGRPTSLVTGEPTLLLVFHSECAQGTRVAPLWAEWLDEHRGQVRALAVANEAGETASAYAEAHWPGIEVKTVVRRALGGPAHALTSRTPWVFVIDGEGVVLADGVGDDIAEVASVLVDLEERSDGASSGGRS